MKKVLLVALTHQNAFRLARLIWAARTQFPANLDVHGMVVCNSTDPSYAAQANQQLGSPTAPTGPLADKVIQ